MENQSPFTIYNASAGSGKTFTLVKDYLKILFDSHSNLIFRQILALTFTNKAVSEMKSRIIDMLKAFSSAQILQSSHPMFNVLVDELDMTPEQLHQKSKQILERIVHNYAAFDISTIDKFNHKLIRTFAYDLKLPLNFEVELDTSGILAKAVDQLIDQAGSDDILTKVLVDFAIEKADDDRSWDISYDFNNIAQLLINENDIPFLQTLQDKNLNDFKNLDHILRSQKKDVENQIKQLAETTLALISSAGIAFEDFSRQTLPNHFKKASTLDFTNLYGNQLQNNLANRTKIYGTKLDADKAALIDSLLPEIETHYLTIKTLVYTSKFLTNVLKNITPLSVLGAISKSLETLKEADDLLLISEFNSIIHNEIQKQPAPFIYERMGEKFKHYFIDEFQDTSVLQWENLIPLINNATSGQNLKGEVGSAMIVGDAKQAIYRWRGGRAEQFIDLYTKSKTPLSVTQKVKDLPSNFRSHRTIVEFNNHFFEHIADIAFSDPQHQLIYKKAKQEVEITSEGLVELQFLDSKDQDKDALYCQAVLETIQNVLAKGFSLNDICIIVRKSKEGMTIANYLSDHHIPIISSETLLINNAPEVKFINQLITLSLQPDNNEIKIKLLEYLADKLNIEDKHLFYLSLIHLNTKTLFTKLQSYGFTFDEERFSQLPLYEAVESIIRSFHLHDESNAYIQFYLDEVFDYSQKYNASFSGFLEHWERKKDKLSIVSPTGKDAIKIMTIHKSKGLEFPVVIFPYANQDIYFDMNPKAWFPVEKTHFGGFSSLLVNLNKDLEEFNETGAFIYNSYRSQLELDSINLLYVVLTRAIAQLFVISEFDVDNSQEERLTHYSGLFINYLKSTGQWREHQFEYRFGTSEKMFKTDEITTATIDQNQLISTKKEDLNLNILTRSGSLWDTAQEKAIERGNLVHEIMSHIHTEQDVEFALTHFIDAGIISEDASKELKIVINNIIKHQDLMAYFDQELTIFNERDIISKNGKLLRPDRIVINPKQQATIIDYKTGQQEAKHKEQLFDYQHVLEEMGYDVIKKILIYINEDIVIKEI
ncbi:UvrD-helicase domain-containing protein [Psychroserpens sp. BH13MA-6]